MENAVVKETTDILKRLTPKNQSYFMTLVRLAEVAEDAVRHQEADPTTCAEAQQDAEK